MSRNPLSVKALCLWLGAGALLSMLALTGALALLTGDRLLLLSGALLTVCALLWLLLLCRLFARRLSLFTGELCRTLDDMISGRPVPEQADDTETLFARIRHRLTRLYGVLRENRRQVEREQQALQALVSDIAHQVKTPLSNLKMVSDTLLTKPISDRERADFLQGLRTQIEKLDFLLQALVKCSRLETGTIQLEKTCSPLFDTLAQALSGIVYAAESKNISVSVDCPEDLALPHDKKWTAEALFNLLDNAVKYTPPGGSIRVTAESWEMYGKLDIRDTGKGIPERNQAAVFRRFYREEEVHGEPGVGIGLYLAREIVTRQGGYIALASEPGRGSTFSVFLPRR